MFSKFLYCGIEINTICGHERIDQLRVIAGLHRTLSRLDGGVLY